jgi:hypothetical protein
MDAVATPFLMSADAVAHRIARLIARRRGGVVRLPWQMAVLMAVIVRLPDPVVARLVQFDPASPTGQAERAR